MKTKIIPGLIVLGSLFSILLFVFLSDSKQQQTLQDVDLSAVTNTNLGPDIVPTKTSDAAQGLYHVRTSQKVSMLNDQEFTRPDSNAIPVDIEPDWVKQQKQNRRSN